VLNISPANRLEAEKSKSERDWMGIGYSLDGLSKNTITILEMQQEVGTRPWVHQ
jgi:hypothetical protein